MRIVAGNVTNVETFWYGSTCRPYGRIQIYYVFRKTLYVDSRVGRVHRKVSFDFEHIGKFDTKFEIVLGYKTRGTMWNLFSKEMRHEGSRVSVSLNKVPG
jgi:hypothetical protein